MDTILRVINNVTNDRQVKSIINSLNENQEKSKNWLIDKSKEYCNNIGVPFMMFEYDLRYQKFQQTLLKNYPVLTKYEVVNFYKIHILEELSKEFDEILYLDFDAITLTNESFFDAWDLSKGICVLDNNNKIKKTMDVIRSTRSPSAKYFNCQAMLIDKGLDPNNDVINTGIIGARKEDIIKLDFFGNFKDTIDLMTKLINVDDGLYPPNIRKSFRYDNETIFSYKINLNNVPVQWLDTQWHYFFDTQFFIPKETKIVHTVNKDFDTVWRYCEKHNL